MMCPAALVMLTVLIIGSSSWAQVVDWGVSPEASFLTQDERRTWKRLESAVAQEDFKRAYWLRRDPTPDTDRNEFRERVFERIRVADERFTTRDQPGSRTARGLVYVVLGPPAVVRTTAGPLDTSPQQVFPGPVTLPRTALDTTGWEEWVYDREHHAELLKLLRRPVIEIAFVVEQGRDQLQRTGVFAAYRETVARNSIVRP